MEKRLDRVALEEMVPQFCTFAKAAEVVQRPVSWIYKTVADGTAKANTARVGAAELPRLEVLRLALLARLQDALGKSSPVPAAVAKNADEALARWELAPSDPMTVSYGQGSLTMTLTLANMADVVRRELAR